MIQALQQCTIIETMYNQWNNAQYLKQYRNIKRMSIIEPYRSIETICRTIETIMWNYQNNVKLFKQCRISGTM